MKTMSSRSDDKNKTVYAGHILRDDDEIVIHKVDKKDAGRLLKEAQNGEGDKTSVLLWIKGQEDMTDEVRARHVGKVSAAIADFYDEKPEKDDCLIIIKNNDDKGEQMCAAIGDPLRLVVGLTDTFMRIPVIRDAALCAMEMKRYIDGGAKGCGTIGEAEKTFPTDGELKEIEQAIDNLDPKALHAIISGILERVESKRRNMMS
jgi:hypothetical protein